MYYYIRCKNKYLITHLLGHKKEPKLNTTPSLMKETKNILRIVGKQPEIQKYSMYNPTSKPEAPCHKYQLWQKLWILYCNFSHPKAIEVGTNIAKRVNKELETTS